MQQIQLDKKFYTATASLDYVVGLLLTYRQLLLANTITCLKAVEKALNFDLAPTINKVAVIEPERVFSPIIFYAFSKLKDAADSGDVTNIVDAVHYINTISESEIYESRFTISSILTEQWEYKLIEKLRLENVPNKSNDKTLILPLLNKDLSTFEMHYTQTLQLIRAADEVFYSELQQLVTRLKLFNGKGLKAATSASVYGAVFLRIPPPDENPVLFIADHIVHEASHLYLDALLAFDRIVLNENDEKYDAPIRIDPRPMLGIFHATFVLNRMVRVFQKIVEIEKDPRFVAKLELFKSQYEKGINTLKSAANLTPNGQLLVDSF